MNAEPEPTGVVFDVQRYSIHDGPGIRTTVFLKACPLRCLWCQNPESQVARPELAFDVRMCQGCGDCVAACAAGAITLLDGRSWTDLERCTGAGACVAACPHDARTLFGRTVTVGEAFEEVMADAVFYERSGGGVTLSGGDPVSQPRFARALLARCREAGLHTAVDTSGHARWETLASVLEHADLVLYDLKHMDPAVHARLTGASNEQILANARRITHELDVEMQIRVPVVPGCNDSEENIAATARFVATELDPSIPVHLLPFHGMGAGKSELLGRTPFLVEPPSDDRMRALEAIVDSFGVPAGVGG